MQKSSLYKFCTLFSSLMTTVCTDAGVLYLLTEQMPQVKLETWCFISSMKSRLCTCLWQVRTYSRQEFWGGGPQVPYKKRTSHDKHQSFLKFTPHIFHKYLNLQASWTGWGMFPFPLRVGFASIGWNPLNKVRKFKLDIWPWAQGTRATVICRPCSLSLGFLLKRLTWLTRF